MSKDYPWIHVAPGLTPLSSDVYIFKGEKENYIFDAGCNDEALKAISELTGPVNVILSHFHEDHAGNLKRIDGLNIYLSGYSFKHLQGIKGRTVIVSEDIYISDGELKLHIFPMPSSHCKGALAMEVNEEYLMMGDSSYGNPVKEGVIFNAGLVKEQINVLKNTQAPMLVLSHERRIVYKKESIIRYLEKIYLKREKNNPYIVTGNK